MQEEDKKDNLDLEERRMEKDTDKVTFINRFQVSRVKSEEGYNKPQRGKQLSTPWCRPEIRANVTQEVPVETTSGINKCFLPPSLNNRAAQKSSHGPIFIMVRGYSSDDTSSESHSISSSTSSEIAAKEAPATQRNRCITAETLREIIDKMLAKLSAQESPSTSVPAVSLNTHLFIHVAALLENAAGISVSYTGEHSSHFSNSRALMSTIEAAAGKLSKDSESNSVLHGVREGSERAAQYMGETLAIEICKLVSNVEAPLEPVKEKEEEVEAPEVKGPLIMVKEKKKRRRRGEEKSGKVPSKYEIFPRRKVKIAWADNEEEDEQMSGQSTDTDNTSVFSSPCDTSIDEEEEKVEAPLIMEKEMSTRGGEEEQSGDTSKSEIFPQQEITVSQAANEEEEDEQMSGRSTDTDSTSVFSSPPDTSIDEEEEKVEAPLIMEKEKRRRGEEEESGVTSKSEIFPQQEIRVSQAANEEEEEQMSGKSTDTDSAFDSASLSNISIDDSEVSLTSVSSLTTVSSLASEDYERASRSSIKKKVTCSSDCTAVVPLVSDGRGKIPCPKCLEYEAGKMKKKKKPLLRRMAAAFGRFLRRISRQGVC